MIIKSGTLGSVLYVAAHPDDENTRLLSYLARERNYRTGYLSITRGDGGQNLIGKEQGDLLGLIRTQELLAARRVDGAEQFFTRACDFGYSKNPEETFRIWNKDSILSDVVWVIRNFRPDVIICRFPTTGEGGHGHHTASAILAEEAFSAAADPEKYTWQLAYVQPWKTRRLFWNTFNFGSTNTTAPDQLKMDVGIFNPLLGKSHGEVAAESRSNHKSQGFGSAALRGSLIEYFKQLKGDKVENDLFEAMTTDWQRIPGCSGLKKATDAALENFNHMHPERSVTALLEIRKSILRLDTSDVEMCYWRNLKLAENEKLLLACAGFWMEAYAADPIVVPGTVCRLKVQAVDRGAAELTIKRIVYPDGDSVFDGKLKPNELLTINHETSVSLSKSFSQPYWLMNPHDQGIFLINDLKMIGNAENQPALKVKAELELAGTLLETDLPVVYKFTDPVRGEVYRPLEILPPVTVSLSEKNAAFFNGRSRTITVTVKSNMDSLNGIISATATNGWKVIGVDSALHFDKKGEEIRIKLTVIPGNTQESVLDLGFMNSNGKWNKGIRRIRYDHIPEQFYLPDASIPLRNIALNSNSKRIGYIEGAGDDVAACIEQAGYQLEMLDEDALASEDLSRFDAIVTGVRAFNTEQNLIRFRSTLLQYVKNGGNLLVQYNTNNRLGPAPEKIGPYPFTISNQRVTDERSDVRLQLTDHPSMNQPNKITSLDFEGWIQERGIYFAASPDSNYAQPLGMNDPGEKENSGALIIAKFGKGNFVYTGLAFFRELPAGVPGAYRLFTNLLELPEHP